MDYDLCEKCGYVPTDCLLRSVEAELKKKEEMAKKSKSPRGSTKAIINLLATLKELRLKRSKHDTSLKYDDNETWDIEL